MLMNGTCWIERVTGRCIHNQMRFAILLPSGCQKEGGERRKVFNYKRYCFPLFFTYHNLPFNTRHGLFVQPHLNPLPLLKEKGRHVEVLHGRTTQRHQSAW